MPKSSRHKSSHKSKRSSKETRDCYSTGSEEDVKVKDRSSKGERIARASRDSAAGEKRKVSSLSRDGHGDAPEEHVSSKRRKDGGEERVDVAVDVSEKIGKSGSSRHVSEKSSKSSKSKAESRSKSSRRSESGSEKEEIVEIVDEKVESKREHVKEKEHGSDRDRKLQEKKQRDAGKHSNNIEVKKKRGSKLLENTDDPQNPELEKELEKQIRGRNSRDEKDKDLDDKKDSHNRKLVSRSEHALDGRYKEEKQNDGSCRQKCRDGVDRESRHRDGKQKEDIGRDSRHKDGKQREDFDRNSRHRDGKRREDFDVDSRHRDGKEREDGDRAKTRRADKYIDEYVLKDHSSDKFDTKHKRDESCYEESRSRKSKSQYTSCDGSPVYGDRDNKYKDDKGRRRYDDREDESVRPRSTKEQYSDVGKNSIISSKIEIVNDRERPHSRTADVGSNASRNLQASSPSFSSHGAEDNYRRSRQAQSKYRDSLPEERDIRDTNSIIDITGSEKASMPRPSERVDREDDSYRHELSAERYPNSDAGTAPNQLDDHSTSLSIHERHTAEAGVKQSFDDEECGQKNKNVRDLLGNESKGVCDLALETPVKDASLVDGGNLSPSSPSKRTGHLPSSSRPRFHPPPSYRTGMNSPSSYGSFEEDHRSRSNNRYRRSDSNMGRAPGNGWRGVPNWSGPLTGNFVHFQNGPPYVGFHPMMQQYSGPPIFGMRPPMEFAHNRVPYPILDTNGFSSHGHPSGWPKSLDDSRPPSAHGWDVNIGGEHIYGRLDWDHNRTPMNGEGWDANVDMLKGQSDIAELDDSPVHAPSDELSAGQSSQQTRNELNELDFLAENFEFNRSSLAKETSETLKTASQNKPNLPTMLRRANTCHWHVYLSKLDISVDLAHPELYDKYRRLMDTEQDEIANEDSSQLPYIEGVIEARVKISKDSSNTKLFAAINDSVFQRAMSFYEKQREETRACLPSLSNGKKNPLHTEEKITGSFQDSGLDKVASLVPIPDEYKSEDQNVSPPTPCESEEQNVSPPTPREKSDLLVAANSPKELPIPIPPPDVAEMDADEINEEKQNCAIEDTVRLPSNPSGGIIQDEELLDSTSGQLPFSDAVASSGACDKVMSGSFECGLVNLTEIHHSTESTH